MKFSKSLVVVLGLIMLSISAFAEWTQVGDELIGSPVKVCSSADCLYAIVKDDYNNRLYLYSYSGTSRLWDETLWLGDGYSYYCCDMSVNANDDLYIASQGYNLDSEHRNPTFGSASILVLNGSKFIAQEVDKISPSTLPGFTHILATNPKEGQQWNCYFVTGNNLQELLRYDDKSDDKSHDPYCTIDPEKINSHLDLALDSKGVKYAVSSISDTDYSETPIAVHVDSKDIEDAWKTVGNDSIDDNVYSSSASIAIDKNDTIYIALKQNDNEILVKSFDKTTQLWNQVGLSQYFIGSYIEKYGILIDKNNRPIIYFMCRDSTSICHNIKVLRYDRSEWKDIGDFITVNFFFSLNVGSDGSLYIIYSDNKDNQTVVKKFTEDNL
jgi:hypothetical protein